MKKANTLFSEYAGSHRNTTNQWIHYFCVPLIFWSILGLISLIPAPLLHLPILGNISMVSIIVLVLISIYYFVLHWKMAILMLIILLAFEKSIALTHLFLKEKTLWLFLIIFILSWILQFIGHKIEGRKPKFLKDLQFLLIGPLWVLKKILPFQI